MNDLTIAQIVGIGLAIKKIDGIKDYFDSLIRRKTGNPNQVKLEQQALSSLFSQGHQTTVFLNALKCIVFLGYPE